MSGEEREAQDETCKAAPTSLACWTSHVSMSRHLKRFRCRGAALAAADVHLTLFLFIQCLIFASFVTIRHYDPKMRGHLTVLHCARCAAASFATSKDLTFSRSPHSAWLRFGFFKMLMSAQSRASGPRQRCRLSLYWGSPSTEEKMELYSAPF